MSRHVRVCYAKNDHVQQLTEELKTLKNDNQHFIKNEKYYKQEVEYYKKLLLEAGNMVKASVNSMTFIKNIN